MATVTITEILGSDNIAGSRITINSNFSKLTNAINTIETYLDSSFTPGASLNVGSALVKKYTRPITDQIFTCEATGLFGGNLNVGQDSGVTRDSVVGRHETVHGNFTLDGTVGVTSIFTSTIPHSHDGSVISPQLYAASTSNSLVIDPQTLTSPTTTSTSRNITTTSSFKKTSVIRLDWSNYTGSSTTNCDTIILPSVTDANVGNGQIITLIIDAAAPAATSISFALDASTLDGAGASGTAYENGVVFNATPGDADAGTMRQTAITLFADDNGWRILHTVGLAAIL